MRSLRQLTSSDFTQHPAFHNSLKAMMRAFTQHLPRLLALQEQGITPPSAALFLPHCIGNIAVDCLAYPWENNVDTRFLATQHVSPAIASVYHSISRAESFPVMPPQTPDSLRLSSKSKPAALAQEIAQCDTFQKGLLAATQSFAVTSYHVAPLLSSPKQQRDFLSPWKSTAIHMATVGLLHVTGLPPYITCLSEPEIETWSDKVSLHLQKQVEPAMSQAIDCFHTPPR